VFWEVALELIEKAFVLPKELSVLLVQMLYFSDDTGGFHAFVKQFCLALRLANRLGVLQDVDLILATL